MPQTPEERARIARENGAKSRGPVTPEGKLAASRNAIKTGEHSTTHSVYTPHPTVLSNEDRQAFYRLIDELLEIYMPANQVAAEIVNRIAAAQWQITRLNQCLTLHWQFAMVDAVNQPLGVVEELAEAKVMSLSARALHTGDNVALRINRQIDQLELRIARLERRLNFVHKNFPNAATEPVGENTELNPDSDAPASENEPIIYINENHPSVIAAYRAAYPGRKIVILAPDKVALRIDEEDDLPPAPRKST